MDGPQAVPFVDALPTLAVFRSFLQTNQVDDAGDFRSHAGCDRRDQRSDGLVERLGERSATGADFRLVERKAAVDQQVCDRLVRTTDVQTARSEKAVGFTGVFGRARGRGGRGRRTGAAAAARRTRAAAGAGAGWAFV